MTTILTIALLIIAYLFAVGAKAMIYKTSNEIELALLGGTSKHYIVLLVFACFPITVFNGWKVCAWRIKTWWRMRKLIRIMRKGFKKISENHKDKPELQKDFQELQDLIKKL